LERLRACVFARFQNLRPFTHFQAQTPKMPRRFNDVPRVTLCYTLLHQKFYRAPATALPLRHNFSLKLIRKRQLMASSPKHRVQRA
jgi:hypothetical protein